MRQGSWVLGVLGLALAVGSGAALRPLGAQQSASQLVIFRILPASHASVAPVTRPMSLQGVQDESRGSWSIATNQPDRKIVASLDRALPRGSALVVAMRRDRLVAVQRILQIGRDGAQAADQSGAQRHAELVDPGQVEQLAGIEAVAGQRDELSVGPTGDEGPDRTDENLGFRGQ